jgi:hypothetical protein
MPEDARELGDLDLAVDQMQVGPADAACEHAQQQLPRAGLRRVALDHPHGRADALEDHRSHGAT